jgi:hypothetical protein
VASIHPDYSYVNPLVIENPANDRQLQNELNKIRIGLNGTMSTIYTYTWKPLVGMTSGTNPNGLTTYYNYDEEGRLSLVRDHEFNILKNICYNYHSKPANCTWYGNEVQSRLFSKNNCTTGTGSAVTYTVPASYYLGRTLAEANAKALADINQNGQVFANSTGICQ